MAAEMMREMCDSDTECSDNDPDYDGEKFMKGLLVSSPSSEEVDEPDVCLPQKKVTRRRKAVGKFPGSKEAKTIRCAGKRSQAPASTSRATPALESKATAKSLPKYTPVVEERANPVCSVPGTIIPASKHSQVPALTSPSTPAPGSKATAESLLKYRPVEREKANPLRNVPTTTTLGNTPGSNAAEPSPALPSSPNDRAARGLRANPKRVSPWCVPYNVPSLTPPMVTVQDGYAVWDRDTEVIPPVRTLGRENYYCCVEGCLSGNASNKEGLWLFAMPENEQLMSVWNERLPINYERNWPRSPRICFRHFDKAEFVRQKQRLIGLKRDALPIETERPQLPCFNE